MLIDLFFQMVSSVLGNFLVYVPGINNGMTINDLISNTNSARGWAELIPVDTCITMFGYITIYWITKLAWSFLVFVYGKIPILGH